MIDIEMHRAVWEDLEKEASKARKELAKAEEFSNAMGFAFGGQSPQYTRACTMLSLRKAQAETACKFAGDYFDNYILPNI